MFLPDCWLQFHNNKLLLSKTTTVLEQEQLYTSIDISNIPLVVYFTSDFDNRRVGLWMIKLTDWTVQRWFDDEKTYMIFSCNFGCIHCQSYFATYCDIWVGNSDAINCTPSKLWYVERPSCSEKQIRCDDQIVRFELKCLKQTQVKHIVTLKSLRPVKNFTTSRWKRLI